MGTCVHVLVLKLSLFLLFTFLCRSLCVDRAIEKRVDQMTKEITHLKRFCESLQTQLRMVQAEAMKGSRPPVSSPTLSEEGGGGGGGGKEV